MHKRVLTWCNRQRAIVGAKPLTEMPRGAKGSPYRCPIAQALWPLGRVKVGRDFVEVENWVSPDSIKTPRYVIDWVARFDHESYPDLVDPQASTPYV